MISMTYGGMPTRDDFDQAWECHVGKNTFSFRNDKRVGDWDATATELWDEMQKAHAEFENGSEAAGDWLSSVMWCLGYEWI